MSKIPYPLTLAQFHEQFPELVSDVWLGGVDANQWWFCLFCFRCTLESNLCVWKFPLDFSCPEGDFQWMTTCSHCESDDLFRWSGWPSRVVREWVSDPDEGKEYSLPDSIFTEEQEPIEAVQ